MTKRDDCDVKVIDQHVSDPKEALIILYKQLSRELLEDEDEPEAWVGVTTYEDKSRPGEVKIGVQSWPAIMEDAQSEDPNDNEQTLMSCGLLSSGLLRVFSNSSPMAMHEIISMVKEMLGIMQTELLRTALDSSPCCENKDKKLN
jgi:hypothetical protein